jgi:hypothetical protein
LIRRLNLRRDADLRLNLGNKCLLRRSGNRILGSDDAAAAVECQTSHVVRILGGVMPEHADAP